MKQKKFEKWNIPLLLAILVAGVLLIALIILRAPGENMLFTTEQAVDYSTGWVYVSGENETLLPSLPTKLDVKPGESYTISHTLPADLTEGATLCIRASMSSLVVRANGTLLYERGTDPSQFIGKSIGSSWNLVRIPKEYAGGRIRTYLLFPIPFDLWHAKQHFLRQ